MDPPAKRARVNIPQLDFAARGRPEFGFNAGGGIPADVQQWHGPAISDTEGKSAVAVPFRNIPGVCDDWREGDLLFAIRETAVNALVCMDEFTLATLAIKQKLNEIDDMKPRDGAAAKTSEAARIANARKRLNKDATGSERVPLFAGLEFDPSMFTDRTKFKDLVAPIGVFISASPVRQTGRYPYEYQRPTSGRVVDVLSCLFLGSYMIPNPLNNTAVIPAGSMLYVTFKGVPITEVGPLRDRTGATVKNADVMRRNSPKHTVLVPVWYASQDGRPPHRASYQDLLADGQPPLHSRSFKEFFLGQSMVDASGTRLADVVTEEMSNCKLRDGITYRIGRILFQVEPVERIGSGGVAAPGVRIRTPAEAHAESRITVDICIEQLTY